MTKHLSQDKNLKFTVIKGNKNQKNRIKTIKQALNLNLNLNCCSIKSLEKIS